jgi:glucose/arabinose dehydrogenase
VEEPFDNHNGGRIAFNPLSGPGDPDFGLLYLGLADGGAAGDELDIAQNLGGILGKILRIHPLGSNSANGRYGVPADNPYAHDGIDRTLGEIYASGLRNPQGYDWDRVTGDILVADIGQSVVEKLSRVRAGADLGWNTWEGSYRYASQTRVDLTNPRAEPWITFPVAEFDHQDPLLQRGAAASGVVAYRESTIPQLTNRVLWGDLTSGEILHVAADGLRDGGQARLGRVLFRDGGERRTLLELIRAENAAQGRTPAARADLHFGRGPNGRVFVLNKWDGQVREIVP